MIRLLTDKVLFDPGAAVLKQQATSMLAKVSHAHQHRQDHPIMVEGHTDNVPISGSQFPSNWELSTARASVVVRFMINAGVDKYRLGAAGYAVPPSGRLQCHGGRAIQEPPRRDRAASAEPVDYTGIQGTDEDSMEGTNEGEVEFIVPLVLVILLGGVYKTVLAKPPARQREDRRHGLRPAEGVPAQHG